MSMTDPIADLLTRIRNAQSAGKPTVGVGASKRVSAVRWGVAQNILVAWVLTIPISALVSALTYWGLRLLIGR